MAKVVDRTARQRTLVALLCVFIASVAVVLGVLFVASVMGSAQRDRSDLQHRLTNLEGEFRSRTGQEPGQFETTTTAPPRPATTLPAPKLSPSTAPAASPGRSPSTTGARPSPPATAAPAPSQPPGSTTTTSTTVACLGRRLLQRCALP